MNSRWLTLVSVSLVAFAIFVITWQFRHWKTGDFPSLAVSCIRAERLSGITNIVERSQEFNTNNATGTFRRLDLMLPKDVRIFMTGMTGPANFNRVGYYFYATYYLFPREIGVSLDQPTRMAYNEFTGRTSESNEEIFTNGFSVRFDIYPGDRLGIIHRMDLPLKPPTNPSWFNSNTDTAMAFLLPLLTALAGMWLFRFLFPMLKPLPLPEQLACSLGLGMMAVAALTLGVKLCGFSGRGLILPVTALGSVAEIWRERKTLPERIVGGCWKMVKSPMTAIFAVVGLIVFLIIFRLAGLQELIDPDATRWMLKAKIIHLYTGSGIVKWFSNPALGYAHLDYPTLVPSLHAATYDSLGHVDEFVTKFWPAWMLLFLVAALASLNRGGKCRFYAPYFGLLGLLLLPVTQSYVQMEGGTLPMVFFTVLGFVQCARWLMEKDRARLGLGLTLLFGAAMAKFEGFIFLALVGSWILLLPAARPSLKPSPHLWPVLAFCLLTALPFVSLRVQIPSLHFESGWAGYALHHPGSTLANWPRLFLILLARLFVSPDFASWSGEGGRLHWIGRWDGLSSLYNPSTLGLAWLCLFMAVALWFAVPARRQVIVWILAMLAGALAAFSGVFASFANITDLDQVIGYTANVVAGRYLLPVLVAWFATMMTVFFAELPSSTSVSSNPGAKPAESHPKNKAGEQRHLK